MLTWINLFIIMWLNLEVDDYLQKNVQEKQTHFDEKLCVFPRMLFRLKSSHTRHTKVAGWKYGEQKHV